MSDTTLQVDRWKKVSEERGEQAETAEFQVATISQEYRKLIESRDTEIRRLKTENQKLRDDAKGFAYDDPHSPLKELAQLQLSMPRHNDAPTCEVGGGGGGGGEYDSVDIDGGTEWAGQYHQDFSDVITSQSEINRLRQQLSKTRAEVQHWRSLAENKVRTV